MGCQSEVMHCYEQIAPLTDRMLVLAHAKQWGDLPALEAQNSDLVDRLKVIEPLETLNESQVARKYHLLSRINANQSEVSSIVMPQLQELSAMLQGLACQQSLDQTYGQNIDLLS